MRIALLAITWSISALTLISPIGYYVGETMFKTEKQNIQMYTRAFVGDIMYESRDHLFVRFKKDEEITKIKKDRYETR